MRTLTLSTIVCGVSLLAGCEEKASETAGKSDQAKGPDPNVSALSSPFEALPSQPRFQLSNLRFPSPNSFTVNWRVTSGQATGSWTLAVLGIRLRDVLDRTGSRAHL